MSQYTAITTFHHPDGVLLPGETAKLSDEVAARGLEAGSIGPVQNTFEPDPPVAEAAETQE